MPLSMITKYSEISAIELGVLERQFQQSLFHQQKLDSKPKKLAIFDFDSTLFFSPLLSPTIWHPKLVGIATSESVYGPGWWRDIRSLDLGPMKELEKTAWEGYWNEHIVKQARECIKDPETMTIVLTGRRYHPFHQLIPHMLESKNLTFDLIGLRPDPESVSDNHWEANNNTLSYNLTPSVYKSTMHFKTCFILNILHLIPTLQHVTMWDDRIHHVKKFQEYLNAVKDTKVIQTGKVIFVPGIRPRYDPEWQKDVVSHIIETHNQALLQVNEQGKQCGKMNQRLDWKAKPEDPLDSGSKYHLEITPLPAQTVISLSKDCTEQLKDSYQHLFYIQSKALRRTKWKSFGGEEPTYFGDYIYISKEVIPSENIVVGPIGTQLNVTITAYSDSPSIPCLLLQVQVEGDNENKYILPLWYKPSEFYDISRLRNIYWKSIRPTDRKLIKTISGTVDYAYRLGVVEKMPITKKRPHNNNNNNSNGTNQRPRLD